MSSFEIKAYRLTVADHPNAERLDIIKLQGQEYVCIAQKGLYQNGDVALYIPVDALVPEHILKPGFWDESRQKGMLGGSLGNRVRPKRLRGIFSEGILIRPEHIDGRAFFKNSSGETQKVSFDIDYAEFLGITKYVPNIPQNMRVKAIGEFLDLTIPYDFENIKKDPDMFYNYQVTTIDKEIEVPDADGKLVKQIVPQKIRKVLKDYPEEVWISEKLHGTLCMTGLAKESLRNDKLFDGKVYFSSKGLGGRGIILDHTDEENVYVKAIKSVDLFNKLSTMSGYSVEIGGEFYTTKNSSLLLFAEVYGTGVQDLTYGTELGYRLFDACIVISHQNYVFLEYSDLCDLAKRLGLPLVPVLYVGPFDPVKLAELTDGNETVSGKAANIREGVVVKSTKNFYDARCVRWFRNAAKSISEAYHERKAPKGVELTEFQ